VSDRLSSIEAVMWNVGHEPSLRMTVGSLMFLDRPPARADLIKRLGAAAGQAPRLRQYPGRTFVRRHLTWVDDARFDVRNHVRTMTIPLPGEQHQVLDLIALLEPVPFERDRSPWDVTVIDGLKDGAAALYLRAHHVLTDGMGGIPLIGLLLDEAGGQGAHKAPPTASQSGDAPAPPSTGRRPNTVTIDFAPAVRLVGSGLNSSLSIDPGDILVRGIQRSLDVASSVSRQALVTGGSLSALSSTHSMGSRFEVISVDGARAAALSLGGSRNDLLVAAAAGGFGLYEALLGRSCPELRVASPTTLRHGAGIGGNWYAPMRIEVPTAVEHPGPQFGIVAERLAQARSEPTRSVSAALAAVLGRFPTQVLTSALSAQANTVDFAATTLPGFRGDRHVCGALVQRTYPFGPRLGCPMNISAFGNDGRLDVGIALDIDAIAEPDVMLECVAKAFDAFIPNPEPDPGGEPEAAGSPVTQGGEG
jgi:diacylglycerol O-acyltransferase / wax synthase